MQKLSPRAKNLLERANMQTWDGFYYHLFVKQEVKDYIDLRGSGVKSQKELATFTRNFLDPQGKYDKLNDKFYYEYHRLNKYAKPILKLAGLSLFETFYYKIIIKREVIDLGQYGRNIIYTSEAQSFIESMCSFLCSSETKQDYKIYFNPNNPNMSFTHKQGIKEEYTSEFEALSKSTKDFLVRIRANDIDGFYTSFISSDSTFNKIFNDFGESNLLEILRFRSTLIENIKKQINKPST